MAQFVETRLLMLLVAGMPLFASGQILVDPTRPPAAPVATAVETEAEPGKPVLQSILISERRRIATISGAQVKVGENVGDATVVRIAENEVTLRSGKQEQTLKLFAPIDKQKAVANGGSANVNPR